MHFLILICNYIFVYIALKERERECVREMDWEYDMKMRGRIYLLIFQSSIVQCAGEKITCMHS